MRETFIRSLSGAAYIFILSAAVFYSGLTFLMLFWIFLILCTMEFCSLVKLNKLFACALAFAAFLYPALSPTDNTINPLLITAAMISALGGLAFLFGERINFKSTSKKFLFLVAYIVLPFILLVKIPFQTGQYHPEILFGIFLLVWVNDTFAFIVGKSIGKRKLMERISPKKTIEGFLGGAVFALIAALILSYFYKHYSIYVWLIIALIMSIFGTIGDLIESKFKRIANVKDSGKIMPGHGGILDRLDSVIFGAPFVFLLFQIIKYVP